MLNQVLFEIKNAQGPITIRELSRKLKIEPQALEGMLQFWVRKGRIRNDDAEACDNETGSCGTACSGTLECAFIAKMPKTYSLPVVNSTQETRDPQ